MTMMIAVTMTHDPNIDTIVLQFAEMPAASAATSARLAALTSAARAALSNGDDNQISPAPPKRGIPQSDLEELPQTSKRCMLPGKRMTSRVRGKVGARISPIARSISVRINSALETPSASATRSRAEAWPSVR